MASSFFVSAADQPHPRRTQEILKAHPQVRGLMGRNPWTALIMAMVLSFQIALCAAMGDMGVSRWWLAALLAYGVGAFANHCLYVVIHDATHRLIFRGRFANNVVAILADLPNVFPGAVGFTACHLQHHSHQGDYLADADIAADWEARLVGNRWYMKALWFLVYPLVQLTRPARISAFSIFSAWTVVNIASALAFDAGVVMLFGWNALIYLTFSLFFSIGLHPLGGRWIQEHFTLDEAQETGSYYGPLNLLALNVGYHNEHHDFPSVPWNRLPRIREAAPEFYASLKASASWTSLWLDFLFDPRYSLYSRVLRARG